MSKKLLAILAALSVAGCVVTACGDDDNDNSGDSCTIGQKACVGTDSIKVCLNNKWSDAQKCPTGQTCSAGANGDAACGAGGGGTCTAGATMCDGNNLKVCTGTTWTSTACPTGTTCTVSGTTATCAPNGQTTCTNGQTQCVNNVSQICSNGTWTNGGNACGSTPTTDPKAGDPCDESSYPGGCSNDGTKRYYCQSGALVEKTCDGGKTCVAKGNNSSSCEGGETCTKETYQAGCTDSLNGSYCGNNGTVVTVKCTADKPCVNNDGYIKCDNGSGGGGEKCDANSTQACQKNCTDDKSTGYYWNGSKLVTVTCAKKDCIINSENHVVCESEEGGGEACTKENYPGGCTDELNGSYCGNKGTVVKVSCTADKPCNNNNGYISCKAPQEKCNAGSTSGCEKNCTDDKSTGYYWNGTKLVTVTCAKKDCIINSENHVVCESEDGGNSETCTKETYAAGCSDNLNGSYCGNKGTVVKVSCKDGKVCNNNNGYISCIEDGGTCTYGSYEPKCDGDVALFCQYNGTVKKETCNAGQCVHCTDGYTFCNKNNKTCANVETGVDHSVACNGDKKLSGGTDGDCCDVVNYMPACNAQKVTYCSSVGKVKTKACAKSCSVNESTKEYTCQN